MTNTINKKSNNDKVINWTRNDGDAFVDRLLEVSKCKTQAALCEDLYEIKLSPSDISYWRNASRKPNLENLIYISKKYKCSVDYLLFGDIPAIQEPIDTEPTTSVSDILMHLFSIPQDDISFIRTENKKPALVFNNDILSRIVSEWGNVKKICQMSPVGEKLFNVWKKDIIHDGKERLKKWGYKNGQEYAREVYMTISNECETISNEYEFSKVSPEDAEIAFSYFEDYELEQWYKCHYDPIYDEVPPDEIPDDRSSYNPELDS